MKVEITIIAFVVVTCLVAVTMLTLVFRANSTWGRVGLLVSGIIFAIPSAYTLVAFKPGWFDARYKVYQAFYDDIHVGMTRDEVLKCMSVHYTKGSERLSPNIISDDSNSLGFFMNPEKSGEPNCEGIFLDMKSGIVVRKRYSAD